METKKVRQLDLDDIGQRIAVHNEHGDRITGALRMFAVMEGSISVDLDSTSVRFKDPDAEVEFLPA